MSSGRVEGRRFHVYILRCEDGTLYVGSTADLLPAAVERVAQRCGKSGRRCSTTPTGRKRRMCTAKGANTGRRNHVSVDTIPA